MLLRTSNPKSDAPNLRVLGGQSSVSWSTARDDIVQGLRRWDLWGTLGWIDIRNRYRRSVLGPFWLTMTQAITIGSIGLLFSFLFGIPFKEYFPYLTLGMLVWGFIAAMLNDACLVFIANESFIKQLYLPKTTFVLRLLWRNVLMLGHYIVIYVPVIFICSVPLGWNMLWFIPGLALVCLNAYWLALLFGMVCTRFRDVVPLVTAMIQVAFFVTPVMWKKEGMGTFVNLVAALNPLSYLLEIVRGPLLGKGLDVTVLLVSFLMTIVGFGLTLSLFRRYRARIPYWL